MKPDATDIPIIEDYDVPGWLHDRFGFDMEAHYVSTKVDIHLEHLEAARVHFDLMVTREDLQDLLSRRKERDYGA